MKNDSDYVQLGEVFVSHSPEHYVCIVLSPSFMTDEGMNCIVLTVDGEITRSVNPGRVDSWNNWGYPV